MRRIPCAEEDVGNVNDFMYLKYAIQEWDCQVRKRTSIIDKNQESKKEKRWRRKNGDISTCKASHDRQDNGQTSGVSYESVPRRESGRCKRPWRKATHERQICDQANIIYQKKGPGTSSSTSTRSRSSSTTSKSPSLTTCRKIQRQQSLGRNRREGLRVQRMTSLEVHDWSLLPNKIKVYLQERGLHWYPHKI